MVLWAAAQQESPAWQALPVADAPPEGVHQLLQLQHICFRSGTLLNRLHNLALLFTVCAEARSAGTCVGGWPRISTAVKSLRLQAQRENAAFFFLDAGDEFTGTMWDAVYQGQTVAPLLLNMVKPDAMVSCASRALQPHSQQLLLLSR